jgi:hypothetical protein
VDVVFLHRGHEERAGDGAANRRRVEVRHARRRDVERAALQDGQPLRDELGTAVDQARLLGPVLQRPARDVLVVRLVRLTEVGGVRVGNGPFRPHPVQRGAGIEAAGERNAYFLARGKCLKDIGHQPAII